MTDYVIETDGITRYFGKRAVVRDVSLRVPRGSVFGFLGRNGSGKSTTLRMLMGLLAPTRGAARVLGHDSTSLSPSVRARIGYMPEGHPVFRGMLVDEFERFQRTFYPTWNPGIFSAVLSHFRVDRQARAGNLSRGQRAGLCLAAIMAPEPELLILDEPALGLDPLARRSLLEAIVQVTQHRDRTILFSSHLLSDIERVADHIAVLDDAVLRAQCPLDTFRERICRYLLRFERPPAAITPIPGLLRIEKLDRALRISVVNGSADVRSALLALQPDSLEDDQISLEDAFLDYLGNSEDTTSLFDRTGATS